MKLAIMQPYFFPYIGYFQLIYAVDKFIFYDDVNFIKQGWINRNRILINGNPDYFTVPLRDVSSFKKIKDIQINDRKYPIWEKKFLKTLYYNYKKAPNFENVYNLVQLILKSAYDHFSISKLAADSVIKVCNYLNIVRDFEWSSLSYGDTAELKKEHRLIEICKMNNADKYYNPEGGEALYDRESFNKHGIKLFFLKSLPGQYNQTRDAFYPNLSIIDVLMFNDFQKIDELIKFYEIS